MIYFLTILNFGFGPGPPRFGFPLASYRLGQIAQGGSPSSSAIICSAFGQGTRNAFLRDPAAYPFLMARLRRDPARFRRAQPVFQIAATISAGCQSLRAIFFVFCSVLMGSLIAVKFPYVKQKNAISKKIPFRSSPSQTQTKKIPNLLIFYTQFINYEISELISEFDL